MLSLEKESIKAESTRIDSAFCELLFANKQNERVD